MFEHRVVPNVLRRRAVESPDARFVKCGGDWITVGAMDARSDRVAAGLAELGVAQGDRVVLLMANREEFFDVFFACAKIGAIVVSINTFLKGEFLRFQLADCGATVAVVDAAGARALSEVATGAPVRQVVLVDETDERIVVTGWHSTSLAWLRQCDGPVPEVTLGPTDLLGILYTSGTTGPAKGCMLSHGYYTNVPSSYVANGRLIAGERVFTAYPLFHTAGQVICLMAALTADVELVIEPSFSASTFMARAREEQASMLWGVGAMAHALLAQPPHPKDRDGGFRLAQFQPLAPDRQLEFQERFATPVMTEGYGQTECVPITSSAVTDERRRESIGRPVTHLEVEIHDEHDEPVAPGEVGEIVTRPRRPDVMFSGYWGRPEQTAAVSRNLWHHTGDYGRADADGYLYFVDRRQDVIRRRGENISSFELEATIGKHPGVDQIAVHAVPAEFGEDEVKAVIVVRAGTVLEPGPLFEFFVKNLPYFAVPRFVELVDSLPRNGLQKVLKAELRARGVTEATWDMHALGFEIRRQQRR